MRSEAQSIAIEECSVGLAVRYFAPDQTEGKLYRLNSIAYCPKCRVRYCDCGEPLVVDLSRFDDKRGKANQNKSKVQRNVVKAAPISRVYEFPTPRDIEKACLELQATWTEAERQLHRNRAIGIPGSGAEELEITSLNSIHQGRIKKWI